MQLLFELPLGLGIQSFDGFGAQVRSRYVSELGLGHIPRLFLEFVKFPVQFLHLRRCKFLKAPIEQLLSFVVAASCLLRQVRSCRFLLLTRFIQLLQLQALICVGAWPGRDQIIVLLRPLWSLGPLLLLPHFLLLLFFPLSLALAFLSIFILLPGLGI